MNFSAKFIQYLHNVFQNLESYPFYKKGLALFLPSHLINKLCYSTPRLLNEFIAILARKDLVDFATQTDFEVHNNDVGVNIADATNAADNQCNA